jgi:hypothetical protein
MNNHQRGIYQPLMDNVPVYDLSEEEVEEEERSRLPLLIVIALVVLAAFAGVVWLAYNQGVSRGRASAALIINAPEGPVRTAPVDAGGLETPYTGLKVYNQPVSPDQEAQTSALASPPVQVAPSASLVPEPVAKPNIAPPPAVTAEAPPLRLNPDNGANIARQAVPGAAANSATAQTAAPKGAIPPAVASPAAKAPPAPATKEASAAPARAAATGPLLQVGAYESEGIANGAWTSFKARHADVTANLSRDIQKADLGAKGIWYRLRIGPFVDKAAAIAACEKLRAEGGTCFVTAP